MSNEYNRYNIKIRPILDINTKTIRQQLATALEPQPPSYPTVVMWPRRFRQRREDVNDHRPSASPLSRL